MSKHLLYGTLDISCYGHYSTVSSIICLSNLLHKATQDVTQDESITENWEHSLIEYRFATPLMNYASTRQTENEF